MKYSLNNLGNFFYSLINNNQDNKVYSFGFPLNIDSFRGEYRYQNKNKPFYNIPCLYETTETNLMY